MMRFYEKYLQQNSPKKEDMDTSAGPESKQKRSLLEPEDAHLSCSTILPKKKIPPHLLSKG